MGAVNFTGKVWGANIVPTPAQVAFGISAWTQLFVDWDWSGWVKPQVDAAASLGCNCINMTGCADGLHAGTLTQAQINARWVQLADYCDARGMALYPRTGAFNQLAGMTNAETADYTLAILDAIDGQVEIIGCDIISEADIWDDNGAGFAAAATALRCQAMYTLVKAGTSLPCTFAIANNWTGTTARTWASQLLFDYLDFHPYAVNGWTTPLPVSEADYWLSTYSGWDILFGEGGSSQNQSTADQNTWLDGIGHLVMYGGDYIRGWCQWAITDQDTVSSNQWGIYDASFTPRANKVQIMEKYAKAHWGHRPGVGGASGMPVFGI